MKNRLRIINLMLAGLICITFTSCHNIKFNSQQWKEWEETELTMCLRWDMRKDLVRQYDLVGMTVTEIKELLGEPTNENKKSIAYDLGPARKGIDYGTLYLTFENGKVVYYTFWRG